ncbi:(d)CMP kinase [Jeotgalibaca ciconiae]|uniref:Cytidylate kinase n=1 Tax=Jeotgalibaca ciconiae TaxID=2496265 RepID=A0A3Q9BLR8_9LACT|nr:(d)CMP kinase [Jeotgalibaca ciconiae]AZP05309.1 (d)CMP kinase [Jeotgalibaca ciconiae]
MDNFSIAIDGPASAGKSTIAKKVAGNLGFIYLDTGAMYRSLTYIAIKESLSLDNEDELVELLDSIEITFSYEGDRQKVFVNGEDVTELIREKDVTQHVSLVSAHTKVREEMVARQQKIAATGEIVMDGRDIGTVVLPKADLKIFLVASAEERALRRYKESVAKGMDVSLEQLTKELKERDYYDSNRIASPLKKADDAIELDSTHLSIDEVVEIVLKLAVERKKKEL